jgi:hypothetical protein
MILKIVKEYKRGEKSPSRKPPAASCATPFAGGSTPATPPHFVFILLMFFIFLCSVQAQSNSKITGPYQVPTTIYIGDRGKLIFPLDRFFNTVNNADALNIKIPNKIDSDDIIINKIEYDKLKTRLIIDFQCFRTGIVRLPPITFGNNVLDGMEVNIASLLDSGNSSFILHPHIEPLAARGTIWLISLSLLCAVIIIFVIFIVITNGKKILVLVRDNLKYKYFIFLFDHNIKHMNKNAEKGKINYSEMLSFLSVEFRKFLSRFLVLPCVSMVPEEFLQIDIPALAPSNRKEFLYNFFSQCDSLRFSGDNITAESVNRVIEEARSFIHSELQETK